MAHKRKQLFELRCLIYYEASTSDKDKFTAGMRDGFDRKLNVFNRNVTNAVFLKRTTQGFSH